MKGFKVYGPGVHAMLGRETEQVMDDVGYSPATVSVEIFYDQEFISVRSPFGRATLVSEDFLGLARDGDTRTLRHLCREVALKALCVPQSAEYRQLALSELSVG